MSRSEFSVPTAMQGLLAEPPADAGITATGVSKVYPLFRLGPLTLELQGGEVLALVGANGAGKTTLLSLLARQTIPSSGAIVYPKVGGSLAERCGYVTDADDLPQDLAAEELWHLVRVLSSSTTGRAHATELTQILCEYLDFSQRSQLIKTLSHGNQQKAKLIATLLPLPPVLLLDEPRNGLDAVSIEKLDALVNAYAASGRAVLIATHDLHYAERSSTRIFALHAGQMIFDGAVAKVPDGLSFADWYLEQVVNDFRKEALWAR